MSDSKQWHKHSNGVWHKTQPEQDSEILLCKDKFLAEKLGEAYKPEIYGINTTIN